MLKYFDVIEMNKISLIFFFLFRNVAIRNFKSIYVDNIISLLVSAAL